MTVEVRFALMRQAPFGCFHWNIDTVGLGLTLYVGGFLKKLLATALNLLSRGVPWG